MNLKQAYINFETAEGEFERARALYERLLDRTKHLKVWISYAEFEATAMAMDNLDLTEEEQKKQCIQSARSMGIQCCALMLLSFYCLFSV